MPALMIWFTEYQKSEVCKAAQGTVRMKPDDMQTHDRAYVLVVRLTAQEMPMRRTVQDMRY
jgi:hypothetical protein